MFSVVIASYNHARYVVEAVESALCSPLVTEVVIVDDGSTDRSWEMLRREFDGTRKVRLIEESDRCNRGAPARWNQLCKAAKNEWIAPLNSDDGFCFGRFEAVAEHIRRASPQLVFGDLMLMDEFGRRKGRRQSLEHGEVPWPAHIDAVSCAKRGDWLALFGIQNLAATTTNMVFHASLFDTIGGFRNYRYVHDWEFLLRACVQGAVHYLPTMTSRYRQHGANTINERRGAIESEAASMFRHLISEFPQLAEHTVGNPYLAIEPPESVEQETVPSRDDVAARGLIYQPMENRRQLTPTQWRHVWMALEMESQDGIVVSQAFPGEPLRVRDGRLANNCVFTARGIQRFRAGEPLDLIVIDLPEGEPGAPPAEENVLTVCRAVENAGRRPYWRCLTSDADSRRVIFVLPAFFAVGGVERITLRLISELSASWRFVVIATEPLQRELGSLSSELEGLADYIDLSAVVHPTQILDALAHLKDVYDPALVWFVNGSPWLIQQAEAIRNVFASVPICNQQAYDVEAGWIAYFDQPEVQSADHFVAINGHIQRALSQHYGLGSSRTSLIHHCIDERRFSPDPGVDRRAVSLRRSLGIDPAVKVFLFVGRLTAQKRPQRFLDLAADAARTGDHFLMVGSGEENDAMETAIAARRPRGWTWLPSVTDMPALYRCADALIVTSDFEGLPCVVLEALSMERPVLATDVGDIAWVAKEFGGVTVVTQDVNLNDAFSQWRADLEEHQRDAEQVATAVRNRFSGETVGQLYRELFQSMIRQRRSPCLASTGVHPI